MALGKDHRQIPSGKFARIFNDTKSMYSTLYTAVMYSSCETDVVQLPVPLNTHAHTQKFTCVRTSVCYSSLPRKRMYKAGPMDKSGITTLVGFSIRGEKRERKNNKIHTQTGYILYAMHFTVSFMR